MLDDPLGKVVVEPGRLLEVGAAPVVVEVVVLRGTVVVEVVVLRGTVVGTTT
ncbi:MAG: hypothetical protein M0Z91_06205 [Actinomycetota bacterium]|nr:hypothetical protein [Actinomycetota bacterium]